MSLSTFKRQVERLLEGTGIQIDGPHPWDIQVHNQVSTTA